jgi:threonine/homoserine/homoserine lactone efflux protein
MLLALVGLLLVLGWMQWRIRAVPGQPAAPPKWMTAVDGMQPTQAFVLGVALSAANPKNLTLAAAAAITIGKASLDMAQLLVIIVVFVLIASVSIIVPVAYYLLGGEGARSTLDGWKAWLEANNATVMTVLLVVMGVAIAGKGLGALLG